jgi:hypothetical protein
VQTIDLKPGGGDIPVTNANRDGASQRGSERWGLMSAQSSCGCLCSTT